MRLLRHSAAIAATVFIAACATGGAASGSTGGTAAKTGDAAAIARAIDVASAPFIGSTKSKKYYPSACHTVKLIKPADQVGFASQKDAESAGYAKDVYSTDCQY